MNDWKATARLTRNPVTGTANNEKRTTYTQFDIAVNRDRKLEGEEQDADFWNCVAFGKTAEFIAKYTDSLNDEAMKQIAPLIANYGSDVQSTDLPI